MKKLLLILIFSPALLAQSTREEIVRLQSDVLQLQSQIRMLQKTIDDQSGMILSLLEQLNDQIAESRTEQQDVARTVRSQTASQESTVNQLREELTRMSAQLGDMDNRMAAIQRRLEENQMRVQTLRTPGSSVEGAVEPDRVYTASYNDYLMGNYELAIAGFQEFLSDFPESRYSDNAAYYLGDSYFRQGRFEQAIQAFDQVINLYPTGDKTPVAYYKKAVAYESLQRMDSAIDTFKRLSALFPDSPEARLAQEELEKLGIR
jgi:tol-pal system protein YbgF